MEQKNELQRNAIAEERRKELEFFQWAMDVKWLNSRMEDGRMGRCLALIAREAALEQDFKQRTDHTAKVNALAEQETKLARAIEETRREEQKELLRRQYLRKSEPCLLELQKKLQAGYVRRDLQQQILHNEYRRLQDKAQTSKANALLNNSLLNEKRAMEQEELLKKQQTSKYCNELQQQLVNKQQVKQCEYEDSLIEKKMLDDIIRTMADEDKREVEHKRQQKAKCRQEMVTFQQARDAWKEKQKKINAIEEKQIEEQQKMVMNRSTAILEEWQRKLKHREEMNEKIAAKILAEEAERQDRDNIIKSLQEQEYLEKNHQNDLKEREKIFRIRDETIKQHNAAVALEKKRIADEKAKDKAYREANEAKYKADMAAEREGGSKKKLKEQQYIRDLKKQIEDNEIRRKKEKEDDAARAKRVWDYHKNLKEEACNERKKIMSEHAPHVLGFLQAGVLQPSDIPHVKEGASKHPHLASLNIDALAVRGGGATKFPKCNAQCRIIRNY